MKHSKVYDNNNLKIYYFLYIDGKRSKNGKRSQVLQ